MWPPGGIRGLVAMTAFLKMLETPYNERNRTLVVGLLSVTVAGIGAGWAVHKDTLRRGQGS